MVRVAHVLDARHLICPLPVIRTQDQVSQLAAGDVLEVICTDPGALVDIPAWCRVHGHELLTAETRGNETVVRLRISDNT